jgi:hypothetical protein
VHETVRSEFENLESIHRHRKLSSFTTGTIFDIPFPPGIKIMPSAGNRISQDGKGLVLLRYCRGRGGHVMQLFNYLLVIKSLTNWREYCHMFSLLQAVQRQEEGSYEECYCLRLYMLATV